MTTLRKVPSACTARKMFTSSRSERMCAFKSQQNRKFHSTRRVCVEIVPKQRCRVSAGLVSRTCRQLLLTVVCHARVAATISFVSYNGKITVTHRVFVRDVQRPRVMRGKTWSVLKHDSIGCFHACPGANRKLKNKTPKVVSDELLRYANAREHAGTLTNKSEGLILTENFRLSYACRNDITGSEQRKLSRNTHSIITL